LTKKYILIRTVSKMGSGFAGYCATMGAMPGHPHEGYRALAPGVSDRMEPHEGLLRAQAAAEAVFAASGSFPGMRRMTALVRVDGGRAVVCQSRGRLGW